jgi:signal transduction histidine kinase
MSAVRLRLTLFYAGLLAVASGLVLGASYLLLREHLHRTLAAPVADRAVSALGSQYLLALIAIVLLALGGGWLVSGEVLGPIARAMRAQRRFVANASHELRTPITAIRAGAEVALDDPAPTVEGLRAVLRQTVADTEQIDRLMTSLLTLAGATDGTRADEAVELSRVVGAVLPRDVRIDAVLEPTTVRGDAALLQRAAANLIDNALRHGRPGGVVTVRLAGAALTVRNGGPLIADEDLQRLTEPFERLRRGPGPGTGLGLSIVQAIADAHGGRLVLEAPAGGGLVACLALPPTASRDDSTTRSVVQSSLDGSAWPSWAPATPAGARSSWYGKWRLWSPASHSSRRPGAARSQSGRISRVTARRSRRRSSIDGRPQNQ